MAADEQNPNSENLTPAEAFKKLFIEERAKAEADRQALIEEFKKQIPTEWSPEDLKEKLRDLLAASYARISAVIDNEDHPKSYEAAWNVMKVGMGQIAITDANDPDKEFKELLNTLIPKTEDQKVIDQVIENERIKNQSDKPTNT